MRIKVLTTFLDGRDRFEKDDHRVVQPTDTETAEERAMRFISNGWVSAEGVTLQADSATDSVDLDIHNSALGLGDSNG